MSAMWGIQGGFRNFAQDQMKLRELALNEREAESLERHRVESRNQQAIELNQRERKLLMDEDAAATEKEKRAALESPGEGEDLATPAGQIRAFRERANRLLTLGYADEAAKLVNTTAQMLQRLEAADLAETRQRKEEYELAEKKARRVQELLVNVRSQADLDNARLAMMNDEHLADEAMHPALQKYDPATVQAMLAGSPAALEKMKLDRLRAEDASKRRLRDARIAYLDFRKGIDERRTRDAETRTALREKAGESTGSGAAQPAGRAPRNNERAEVERVLKAGGLLVDDEDAKELQISSIADDAVTLHLRNRGVSFSEAVEQAIASAKRRGELTETKGIFSNSPKFERQPGSVSRPVSITPGKKTEFKEGLHYRDSRGNVVRFEGGQFVPVYSADVKRPVATTPPAANNPFNDEDDEDEGDD